MPQTIRDYSTSCTISSSTASPSLEAQCAAIADDIAYNTHDIDDGLRAGLLTLDMLDERRACRGDPGGSARPLSGARPGAHAATS